MTPSSCIRYPHTHPPTHIHTHPPTQIDSRLRAFEQEGVADQDVLSVHTDGGVDNIVQSLHANLEQTAQLGRKQGVVGHPNNNGGDTDHHDDTSGAADAQQQQQQKQQQQARKSGGTSTTPSDNNRVDSVSAVETPFMRRQAQGFNWTEYLAMYPTLTEEQGIHEESAARVHWEKEGREKGLLPHFPRMFLQYTACRNVYGM